MSLDAATNPQKKNTVIKMLNWDHLVFMASEGFKKSVLIACVSVINIIWKERLKVISFLAI